MKMEVPGSSTTSVTTN